MAVNSWDIKQIRTTQTRGLNASHALPKIFYSVSAGVAEARSNGIELLCIGMSSLYY